MRDFFTFTNLGTCSWCNSLQGNLTY